MARIKHIALSSDDPAATAQFYKQVFGLEELRRKPKDTGADGVWLTDGYIYFAILKVRLRRHSQPGGRTVNRPRRSPHRVLRGRHGPDHCRLRGRQRRRVPRQHRRQPQVQGT